MLLASTAGAGLDYALQNSLALAPRAFVKFARLESILPTPLRGALISSCALMSCMARSPLTDLRSMASWHKEIWHCASHLTGESRVKSTAGDSYTLRRGSLQEGQALLR
jgi:hypothetical protein